MSHIYEVKSSREKQLETTMREHLNAAAQARKALRVERLRRECKIARAQVRELGAKRDLAVSFASALNAQFEVLEREHEKAQDLLAAVARALGLTGADALGDWLAESEPVVDEPRVSESAELYVRTN